MRPRIAAVLAVAVAVWAAWAVFVYRPSPNALPACTPNAPLECSTIDGFPLGAMVEDCPCGDRSDLERIAVDGFNAREGGHPAIVRTTMFDLDMARFCGPVLCTLTGGYDIFVFQLADGSRNAIAVSCPGVGNTCKAVPTYTAGSAG